ncbi:hypothetical protein SBV1_1510033 [Verrucomicrobia bacterium]|nr:hypothetical protein SBV1_1510033 [Verrucomicrobiota bacterium]
MEKFPKTIAISERIYRKLLCLYPQSHRRDYAEPMTQMFRDQCREAWRTERFTGLMKLWLRALPDIGKSSVQEQVAEFGRDRVLKCFHAKGNPTILLIGGLMLGLSSFSPLGTDLHGVFQIGNYCIIADNFGKGHCRTVSSWQ